MQLNPNQQKTILMIFKELLFLFLKKLILRLFTTAGDTPSVFGVFFAQIHFYYSSRIISFIHQKETKFLKVKG
jgi:hypothetical protein